MAALNISLGTDATISPSTDAAISPWLLNGTVPEINGSSHVNKSAVKECTQIPIPTEVYLILAGVSLLENLLVIIAVIKNRNLHSPMYFFICSLAVSDILLSLTKAWEAITISITSGKEHLFANSLLNRLDDVYDSILCISFTASIFNLAAITTDRYITIFHALRYHNIMTGKRVTIIITAIWVFCTFTGIIMISFAKYNAIVSFFFILFFITLVLIVSLYIFMFLLAQMHAKRIRTLPGHIVHRRANFKGALTLTILLGIFIACWAPFSLHLTLYLFCPSNPYCACFISLFQVDLIFIMCHSMIDPLIYAFRSPELCNTFKKMLCCIKRQSYLHRPATCSND
ncbi:adrenocorticotropic hormone receptor-like [Carcharodon carcharias]|uniref:adrenocorticotropic hormone receptor-like n=1 Tax=Carcharodon carcharias TaxID=13397 RepID=UPI001B7DF630|nr:adrenocorticotropic hormone receptor-like [Carcharodon carcharias]XP_041046188.1 adrenocorticotropic hormone receptor-like [Carcharodon carcharias]XP_041046189.1 adrenocorticotropic hormone receptor-like [Carcharodon carcharias]XP_041046190.1 adrenocorticotropic hormone receptor-like [Carcharodon carcharias]